MKYKIITALIIAQFGMSASLSALSPSLGGSTGLITMPTGESLKYKEVSIAYDYVYAENAEDDAWSYKANLGTFQNWELGVVGGKEPDEGVFLNTKYYLISDQSRNAISVAIGIQNISSKDDCDAYLVASKRFIEGIGLHFGFKANFNEKINPTLMLGADYYVTDRFQIMADLTGEQEDYSGNVGALFYLTKEIFVRGSIVDLTENLYDTRRVSIGLGFSKYL